MKTAQNIFLTKTIPDFLSKEFYMPYIKFVFDEETLKNFDTYLDKNDLESYQKGIQSIEYLKKIREESYDSDEVFIPVHDSNLFFHYLEELIKTCSHRDGYRISDCDNFIRSIWLRMGVGDVLNVEGFLKRQLDFLKDNSVLPDYKEIKRLNDQDVLAYRIEENKDWFETNQNITFSIRRDTDDLFSLNDYDFPAIHFGICKIDNRPTCFIYGIQSMSHNHSESIQDDLQPIRKGLRNPYVSADFLIAISSFLDYLYDLGIKDIEVPTLQVFNYPYHEQLSSSIRENFDGYTEEEKEDLEDQYYRGKRSDKILDFMHTKRMYGRFVDKEDMISQNKSERLVQTFLELAERNPSMEVFSEPMMEGENLSIHLNGKIDVLKDYTKKERTY